MHAAPKIQQSDSIDNKVSSASSVDTRSNHRAETSGSAQTSRGVMKPPHQLRKEIMSLIKRVRHNSDLQEELDRLIEQQRRPAVSSAAIETEDAAVATTQDAQAQDDIKQSSSSTVSSAKQEKILVRIICIDGSVGCCEVGRDAPLHTVFQVYAAQRHQDYSAMRYFFNEKIVTKWDTPALLGLKDGDDIREMIHSYGGRRFNS